MFIPHTDLERKRMLDTIGVEKVEDLFVDVPSQYRFPKLTLPPALTEMEVMEELQNLSLVNETARDMVCFLGAGAYNHYVPAAVDSILRRGEFFTAYTPYQPEFSQGTLQAIFEYQSLMANLTGMDVSNASHYDGATATAEAGVLAYHHFREKKGRFIVSAGVHPQYRATLRTYLEGYENVLVTGDEDISDPLAHPETLKRYIDKQTALVIVQYPDFFGQVFDLSTLAKIVHEADGLLAVVANPTALGLFRTPGEFGADMVVGEGQPLGIPLSYGGPYLGYFTTRKDFVRRMSGRLAGESVDKEGRRGYVLTLTAREQHIRRDKATSNICTNQGLMALAAAVYLSLLGKQGLRQVADLCYQKAHYAAKTISTIPGFQLLSKDPFFHEFVMKCPQPVESINTHLLEHGIIGGYDLGIDYPTLKDHMLIAVTEMIARDDIDLFCHALEEVANE